jgi:hypothetical protein
MIKEKEKEKEKKKKTGTQRGFQEVVADKKKIPPVVQ